MSRIDAPRSDPFGRFVGSMVAVVFGLVFVVVNSAELPTAWSRGLRAVAVVVAVALTVGSVRQLRSGGGAGHGGPSSFGRRYWVVVAVEVVALAVGLVVINGVLDVPRFAVAWVALVVGVHFFGLATIWWPAGFSALGAVMTALGVAGFVVGALGGSAAAIGLVSGVASGAALFAAIGAGLRS